MKTQIYIKRSQAPGLKKGKQGGGAEKKPSSTCEDE